MAETPFTIIYTLCSIAACVYYFSPLLVGISLAQGTVMFIASHFFRRNSRISAILWKKLKQLSVLGIFFHMKYVVIFGVPSIFAKLDNMEPQPGPICISRVMLFSKVWREFDRGLYQFFKTYIFVPICEPTFSLPRKVTGVLVSYSFVLLWHGFYHHNIVWIVLNIISLILEMSAKSLYAIDGFRIWREKTISDVNFRRIMGPLYIVPFAFGLYSNIYFLGGSDTGALFVRRFWDEETVPLRWPFFLLIFLGYINSQLCMEVERRLELQKKHEGEEAVGKNK
ncbi:MBOAT family protein [Necator americanus]|uniref:MBOAT family protein n=1 Tax=Necator americanus TaxID=51031 RepID=W2SJ96_NECAM|nr:MBOAT family protein [Necator americanus]ETN69724.1 MBOAT family protein [Necator americanus]